MKNITPHKLIVVALLLLTVAFTSCKKTSYVTDGGLANAYSKFSTYDYLKNNQYHQFDTVLMLVDKLNLKDTINNAKTFFAFTDMSLHQLMTSLGTTTLDELTDSVSSKLFTQYMFNQAITLDDAKTTAIAYTNYVGSKAPCAIKKTAATYIVNLDNSSPTFTYYILDYIKVNGVLDGSPGAPANDPVDVTLPTQTEGIHTSTGTILHVFANTVVPTKR